MRHRGMLFKYVRIALSSYHPMIKSERDQRIFYQRTLKRLIKNKNFW